MYTALIKYVTEHIATPTDVNSIYKGVLNLRYKDYFILNTKNENKSL